MKRLILYLLLIGSAAGCAPGAHLTFPQHPASQSQGLIWYDTEGEGRGNFAISTDGNTLYYDDKRNGKPNRIYHLSDYADRDVPHAIILLDSIPYESMLAWYKAGHLRFFSPPVKVIPPFPSLTEICYSDVLHAPPLPGMIDQSYDYRMGKTRGTFLARIEGYSEPWERRLDYHAEFWESGLSYLHPRPWLAAELERCRADLDASPSRVTLLYVASASSMVCKYSREGVAETLEGAEQLCLQLLYERHGAIKISLMADHGHNFVYSKNVPVVKYLQDAGFHPGDRIRDENDVVVEINGLVTYAAVQTSQPVRVADVLLSRPEVQLVMYMEGDRVIVRDMNGRAAIECRDRKVRYVPIDGDVLGYKSLVEELKKSGKSDSEGYIADADWISASADSEWPDAPRRAWDAFHRIAATAPRVMFTTRDGYCAGLDSFSKYIDMASTHGGLNQLNSATFVMTMMNAKPTGPLRSRDVLNWLEPGFEPPIHEK